MSSSWSSTKSVFVGGIAVLALLVGSIVWQNVAPSEFDDFAQCLNDNGAKVYSAYWCSNCATQEAMFGTAYRYIDEKECSSRGSNNFDLCAEDDITGTPTWENTNTGERNGGVQSMSDLGEWFGCELPE
ncbi:hypothetical protein HON52_04430 [Candidatus Uhrbacteria bacterium]|jgi:hypothetical protein|nr:hypothetical protein [Candidatus Uhrbacteria bacterium]